MGSLMPACSLGIDEIKTAGFTSVKAEMVNAPLIEECFMNLECRFKWEKQESFTISIILSIRKVSKGKPMIMSALSKRYEIISSIERWWEISLIAYFSHGYLCRSVTNSHDSMPRR